MIYSRLAITTSRQVSIDPKLGPYTLIGRVVKLRTKSVRRLISNKTTEANLL